MSVNIPDRLFAGVLLFLLSFSTQANVDHAKRVSALSSGPLYFEQNAGQTAEEVDFVSRGQGYSLFLKPDEAVFRLLQKTSVPPIAGEDTDRLAVKSDVLRMQLIGANLEAEATGLAERAAKSHYLKGNNAEAWITDVTQFGKVRYHNVFEGIDLVYYGNQGRLQYDFILQEGADPAAIRMRFHGAETISTDGQGRLILKTELG